MAADTLSRIRSVDRTKSMKVLIADDHPRMRKHLAEMLELLGAVVVQAADGVEAVDAFRRVVPDWTCLDIEMPRMGGIEAAMAIRRISGQARIAIVSAHDTPVFREAAARVGAHVFVSKSELHRLVECLRS